MLLAHLAILGRSSTAPPDLADPLLGTCLTHSCSILCHFCVTFVTLKSAHLNSNSIGIWQIPGAQSRHILCLHSDEPRLPKSARKWVPLLEATFGTPFIHPAQPNPYRILPRSTKIQEFWGFGSEWSGTDKKKRPTHFIRVVEELRPTRQDGTAPFHSAYAEDHAYAWSRVVKGARDAHASEHHTAEWRAAYGYGLLG